MTQAFSPRGVNEFFGAMETILSAKQVHAAKVGAELDMEDLKDVAYDARQKVLRDAEDAIEAEKAIVDTTMTETLEVTGKGRKPGEVLAAQIERTLVTAIKNATTVEEVERLERYCKLGLLPQDMS